jgi:hypothetical protein
MVNFVELPQSFPERSKNFKILLFLSPVNIRLQAPHFRSQLDKFNFQVLNFDLLMLLYTLQPCSLKGFSTCLIQLDCSI